MTMTYGQAKQLLATERELLTAALELFDLGASEQAMELLQAIPELLWGKGGKRD